jgi:hypothetical protein
MFEVSFFNMKHPKEIKMVNSMLLIDAKSYVYGKLNHFFILQTGIGRQRILNEKPYWGGVEVRYFYSFGPVLGITKPVYLYIFDFSDALIKQHLEKYDPEKHFYDNIYGRGPFMKGMKELSLYPGINAKFGFNFEHGVERTNTRALEAGVMLSAFLREVQIMSFTKNYSIFTNLYIQYHFGKRW